AQGGYDVALAALHQQALGVQPPAHVVVLEGGDEGVGVGMGQVGEFRFGGVLVDDAVDPAVLLVAQVGLVGVALAGLVADGGGVVLDDVVVPVDHPDVAVGADLGHGGGAPLIVAGQQVPRVA